MEAGEPLLLVEDNPGDALLVRERLRDAGGDWRPVHVASLAAALQALEGGSFGAALVDLQLPDASGLDGVRRLASAHPSLPIVVLTGHSDEMLGLAAIRAGAEDYLVKGRSDGVEIDRSLRFAVERRSGVEALRLERDLIDGVLDASPALMVELQADGTIQRFNPAIQELTGLTADAVVGRSWFDLFATPDRQPATHAVFRQALGGPPLGAAEAPLAVRDGSSRPVAWRWSRIDSEATLIAFGVDVGERRELEERLRDASGEALLGRVVAGVAHEVRNPLFALTACLDVLASEAPEAEWRRSLEALRAPAERLAALTRELSEHAEPESADPPPPTGRLEIERGLERVSQAAAARRVAVERRIEDPLPSVPSRCRLEKTLAALVAHLVSRTPEGEVLRVSAWRSAAQGQDGLSIQIEPGSEAGQGSAPGFVAPEARPDLELGISVALARRRLLASGGRLEVRNGAPLAFRCWVPAAREERE